jgi:aspartyl-tRNA(Asn)/glutamyl-tRNA(Gln) amidotransferase subunit A
MPGTHELSAAAAARAIGEGSLTAHALVEACVARIERLDPALQAWVHVDRGGALAAARQRDGAVRGGQKTGLLHGVPVGVKDIFHVAGMPTRAGARAHAHTLPTADATSVERLRAAGAIVLGKTHTTEFAYRDPAPTTNPWNRAHTPGGSSSGSAAAVAARMVPLALGTQTIGSVLRPAAYCGVVGFKPTHGLIPTDGVLPLAWSLDHVGIFARHVGDVVLAAGVLAGHPIEPLEVAAPRLAVAPALLARATPDVQTHLAEVVERFRRAGASVVEVDLPEEFAGLHAATQVVLEAEAATAHEALYAKHAADYGRHLAELIRTGLERTGVEYVKANRARLAFREAVTPLLAAHDALVSPTAPAPPPEGLAWTGDASLCAPWSSAGVPSISLPSGLHPSGFPLAVQLTQAPGASARLLGVAAWCERVLDFRAQPA